MFIVNEEAIKSVFNQQNYSHLPVALYSISGKRRGGKSFLLHLFMHYIEQNGVSILEYFKVCHLLNCCLQTDIVPKKG